MKKYMYIFDYKTKHTKTFSYKNKLTQEYPTQVVCDNMPTQTILSLLLVKLNVRKYGNQKIKYNNYESKSSVKWIGPGHFFKVSR